MIRTRFLSLAAVAAMSTMSLMPQIAQAKNTAPQTIVDVAAADGHFTTLVAAVKAAGLASTLSSPGPFTVFAPTDDAFAKLPAGTVANLLKPANKEKLKAILLYHVVPGRIQAADIVAGPVKTANGQTVQLDTAGGKVKANDATVIKADIPASNGVIHVIDSVLLPK